jgi:hypothetical protein
MDVANKFESLKEEGVIKGTEFYKSFVVKANKEMATSILEELCQLDGSARFVGDKYDCVSGMFVFATYYKNFNFVQIEGITVNHFRKHFKIE